MSCNVRSLNCVEPNATRTALGTVQTLDSSAVSPACTAQAKACLSVNSQADRYVGKVMARPRYRHYYASTSFLDVLRDILRRYFAKKNV